MPDVSYHFTTREDFDLRLRNGEFLEHADVSARQLLYGTHRSELTRAQFAGQRLWYWTLTCKVRDN